MKKFTLFLLLISAITISCSSDDNPNSGISTNPNFMKGSIKLADETPVAGALVALTNSSEIAEGITDSIGEFSIQVVSTQAYAMEVTYADSIIYSKDTVSTETTPNIEVIITDEKLIEYIDSLLAKDSITRLDDSLSTIEDTLVTLNKSITLNSENCEIADTYITMTDDTIPVPGTSQYENNVFADRYYFFMGSYDQWSRSRGLIQFNLDSLENIETIDSAFFVLKKADVIDKDSNYMDISFTAYPLLKSWKEGSLELDDSITDFSYYTNTENTPEIDGVTSTDRYWDTPWGTIGVGTDGDDAEAVGFTSATVDITEMETLKIDITEVANRWLNGDLENNGLLLVNDNEFNSTYYSYPLFYSADAVDAENSPELIIHYSVKE